MRMWVFRAGDGQSRLLALFVDVSPMADFKREHDQPRVLNVADDPVVADAIPPKPRKIPGQGFPGHARIGGAIHIFQQICSDLCLKGNVQLFERPVKKAVVSSVKVIEFLFPLEARKMGGSCNRSPCILHMLFWRPWHHKRLLRASFHIRRVRRCPARR